VTFTDFRPAAPLSAATPAPPPLPAPPPAAAWTRALASFRRAETRLAALEGTADEDAFDTAALAFYRSLERLLAAPAPDLAALAAKLSLTRRHLAWELPAGDSSMAALEQDARRLAGSRSRTGQSAIAM
jgi:hypothetical protein